ncbi:MAG: PIN domain-containing protein [Candidatus Thiodiazotropha sp. 6PLUC9]
MLEIDLDYGAITIDTSVFDNNGIALEKGLLKQLDQFKSSPVKVIISEIVDNEVLIHLTEKVKDARAKIKQALRLAQYQICITEDNIDQAQKLINGVGNDIDVARSRIDTFYDNTGSEIVKCTGAVEVTELIDRYFNFKAPFEKSADKKYEFPDALALLAIEKYAESHNISILAVSLDKGWADFAKSSSRIAVMDNLSDAISHFQPINSAQSTIESIKFDYISGKSNHVLDAIAHEIENSLEDLDIFIEATSSFNYEEDDVYAEYKSHEIYSDNTGNPEINLIRVEPELIIIQLTANVTCEIHASFDYAVWDSVDKEYLGMGSSGYSIEEKYPTEVLISLSGDYSEGLQSVSVENVEVIDTPSHIDFGEVEPDWRHSEY